MTSHVTLPALYINIQVNAGVVRPLCLHNMPVVSVALSTVERQCSREAAFFHA